MDTDFMISPDKNTGAVHPIASKDTEKSKTPTGEFRPGFRRLLERKTDTGEEPVHEAEDAASELEGSRQARRENKPLHSQRRAIDQNNFDTSLSHEDEDDIASLASFQLKEAKQDKARTSHSFEYQNEWQNLSKKENSPTPVQEFIRSQGLSNDRKTVVENQGSDKKPLRSGGLTNHEASGNEPLRSKGLATHEASDKEPLRSKGLATHEASDKEPLRSKGLATHEASDKEPLRSKGLATHEASDKEPLRNKGLANDPESIIETQPSDIKPIRSKGLSGNVSMANSKITPENLSENHLSSLTEVFGDSLVPNPIDDQLEGVLFDDQAYEEKTSSATVNHALAREQTSKALMAPLAMNENNESLDQDAEKLSSINGALQQPPSLLNPLTEANEVESVLPTRDLSALVETLGAHITMMSQKDLTETTITLSNNPLFNGAQVLIRQHRLAAGEFSVSFHNLNDAAAQLISNRLNQSSLNMSFIERGYNVHILQVTQSPLTQTYFTNDQQNDNFKDHSREGHDRDSRESFQERQERRRRG